MKKHLETLNNMKTIQNEALNDLTSETDYLG